MEENESVLVHPVVTLYDSDVQLQCSNCDSPLRDREYGAYCPRCHGRVDLETLQQALMDAAIALLAYLQGDFRQKA